MTGSTRTDRKAVQQLPAIIPSARAHRPVPDDPTGAIAYLRFPEGTDALVRVDEQGNLVSQSQAARWGGRCGWASRTRD